MSQASVRISLGRLTSSTNRRLLIGILKITVCPWPLVGATCTASSWNRCFSWHLVLMFSKLMLMMCRPGHVGDRLQ